MSNFRPIDRDTGVSAAALGGRVVAGAPLGAVRSGGHWGAGFAVDDRQLSWLGRGVLPSRTAARPDRLRLCHRRVFEPQAGTGELCYRWHSASSPPTSIPITTRSPRSGGASKQIEAVRTGAGRGPRDGCAEVWARWRWMAPRSTPMPAVTARCRMSTRVRLGAVAGRSGWPLRQGRGGGSGGRAGRHVDPRGTGPARGAAAS